MARWETASTTRAVEIDVKTDMRQLDPGIIVLFVTLTVCHNYIQFVCESI